MNQVDAIIGNSSSGILEMPYFQKATINLGTRQMGRLHSKSIINVKINKSDILRSIKIIYSPKFKKVIKNSKNFYGDGGSSKRILRILKKLNTKNLFQKRFFNY